VKIIIELRNSMTISLNKITKNIIRKIAPGLVYQYDLNRHVENWVAPKDLYTKDTTTYVPVDYFGHDGIELYVADQIKLLETWKENQRYAHIFKLLRNDSEINTRCLGENYLHNGPYPTPDAEIYAAMILDYQPLNIVEIGAGFSTIIARKAVETLHGNCKITIIDPAPRTDIRNYADSILYQCLEDVELSKIPVQEKAIIFIDSSHITRARGDIPYLFNRIMPKLSQGTLVHVHDIFMPYDYPFLYQKRFYTEQYILHALLSNSPRYRTIFSTHYMTRNHLKIMQDVFGEIVGNNDLYYGSSYWFKVQ
jgi:predicted O-methyltransferase YrrM